jgi:hypothetical protein
MNIHICNVEHCKASTIALGLCWKHYGRKRRYGNVEFVKRRYRMPHKCHYCGTTKSQSFYRFYKSVCKNCRKLKAAQYS